MLNCKFLSFIFPNYPTVCCQNKRGGIKSFLQNLIPFKKAVDSAKGFTVAELIISIALISIISSLLLANLRGSQPGKELEISLDQAIADTRQVQIMSTGGKLIGGNFPTGGYGIKFTRCLVTPCQYLLFGDFNNNQQYDAAQNEILSNGLKTLLSNIRVNNVSVSSGEVAGDWNDINSAEIIFLPPDKILINNNPNLKYVRIMLEEIKVVKQNYFYLSKISGTIFRE